MVCGIRSDVPSRSSRATRSGLVAICVCALSLLLTAGAHAAPGDLDTSFSGDGLQTTNFSSSGFSSAAAVVRQPDGKIVAVGQSAGGFALARYNPDGSLDTSFSTDGKLTTDFGGFFDDSANGVALQPDGKIVAVGRGGDDFAVARYNPDGSLDTSFSTDGKQTTDFDDGDGFASDVALQPDGKIIAAGGDEAGGVEDFALARYNADGSLDTSFSADGKQTTDIDGFDFANGVALQPDGKIIAVGGDEAGGVGVFALARYNPDGSLDASFSADGTLATDFGGSDSASDVALQPDGKIIVVGVGGAAFADVDFALARYNPDGSLDTSFSTDGKQTTDFGGFDSANDVALQPDGKIIAVGVGGVVGGGGSDDFALARYNPDGSLDTSFSADGKQTTDIDGFDFANGVALQPDGKIVAVGGDGGFGLDPDFALARYNPDGSLDTSFSADGKHTTDFDDGFDSATDVALQPDGKIVAVGSAEAAGGGDFALARYNPDGSLDTSFSADGKQTTDIGGFDSANGVALQPDGKIVAVGSAEAAGGVPDFAVARYNPDGSLDTSFSTDGKQTTDIGGFDSANDVALQPDGKIIAVGRASGGGGDDFALARYNPDGSLDTSFSADGKLTTDIGGSDSASDVALQPDGKIIAVGGGGGFFDDGFALARYNADGSLDTSFSGDGKQTTDVGGGAGGAGRANGVALQPDGRIIAVGGGGGGVFALARYNPDGSLDTSFSADGKQTTNFDGFASAADVALEPHGRIIAVGSGGSGFALARYSSDGSLDTSFSGDGKQTTDSGRGSATGVALQPDGKIIAVGGGRGDDSPDFVVARYEGDAAAPSDTTPPQTSITAGPANGSTTADSTPTFQFSADETGSTFRCRIDGGPAFACASPFTTGALADGQHSFAVAATDAAGNTDPTPEPRSFTVRAPAPQPEPDPEQPTYQQPEYPQPPQPPGQPSACNKFTAKLQLLRGTFNRRNSTISILAPITARASGRVRIQLHAAGRRVNFTAPIDSANRRIRITRRIPSAQARLGTGILTIRYAGDADTRPQTIRVRTANNRSGFTVNRPTITDGGILRAQGTISRRVRDRFVRVQLEYVNRADFRTVTLEFKASVRNGRWSLNQELSPTVRAQIAARCGTVHSYPQFTGYFPLRIRGNVRSFEVLPFR